MKPFNLYSSNEAHRSWTLGVAMLTMVAAGCQDDSEAPPPPAPAARHAVLALELKDSLEIHVAGDGPEVDVTITASAGYGLLPQGSPLNGRGRIEAFPETGATLLTAKLAAPAQTSGPCGPSAVSLALSLHRPAASPRVTGGLTAYCGANRWHGKPPRVLRVSGELQP